MNGIDRAEALALLAGGPLETYRLMARAHDVRLAAVGNRVRLCGVVNAKSGLCAEDCKFCAQSASSHAEVARYPLLDAEQIADAARRARENHAARFGVVTSGTAVVDDADVDTLAAAVEGIAGAGDLGVCASLGSVGADVLRRLKERGLGRYHCNLETSERFFPSVCTTHRWSDSVDTIRSAKELGLSVCCGGLFGLGESLEDRVALLLSIRELDVDSVPLNFFDPVPGTRLPDAPRLTALECVRIVAVARLMMPDKEIRVCGGREVNLRDLQSWALIAGADGLMVGGYLVTKGRSVARDLEMIADAGMVLQQRVG